jgi:membrane fusion protein, multidrug efflux system
MNREWTRRLPLAAAVLTGIVALVATVGRITAAPDSLASTETRAVLELLPQDVAAVELRQLSRRVPLTGTLEPRDWTEVKAQITGQIQEVGVRSGESVQRGQLLARLDAREFRSRLADKRAALAGAEAQLELARKKRESTRAMHERELVSEIDLESAESNFRVSRSNVESLRAQVEQATKALEDTEIRSPLDGVVAERQAQPGAAVTPASELFTVMDLATLELTALVPASDIPAVRIGQEVEFRVEGFAERSFTGTVERINPATEPGSRSIAIYVSVANSAGELRGGMFAQGSLLVAESAAAKVIPAGAVHEESGSAFVFRIAGDAVERRNVEVQTRDEATGTVAIGAGLETGDRVVVGNLVNLEAGAPVRIAARP